MPLAQFLELEPEFEYDPEAYWEQWTPALHYKINSLGQGPAQLPSREGYCLKIAEYQAAVTPEPEPELPQPPDWPAFRLSLMQSATFRTWSEGLPATWREDLKMSALVGNLTALQGVYAALKGDYPPPVEAIAEWQAFAVEAAVPLEF